jgi:hypothetical protein
MLDEKEQELILPDSGQAGPNRIGTQKSRGQGHNQSEDEQARQIKTRLHARTCSICRNPKREEIERDFLAWRSPQEIVGDYKLGSRMAVYRHAHALGLVRKRYTNLRAVLARIMERAGEAPVTAWAVVAAVRACAKINARGQWMEQDISSEVQELVDGMSREELLEYAQTGTLPERFSRELPAMPQLKVVIERIGARVNPADESEVTQEVKYQPFKEPRP